MKRDFFMPVGLFFFDTVIMLTLYRSVLSTLLFLFITQQFSGEEERWSFSKFYLPIFLLLIQDFLIHGRFGLVLVYLVPVVVLTPLIKNLFLSARFIFPSLLTAACLIIESIMGVVLFSYSGLFYETVTRILCTIVVGNFVFWGIRGNRS